MAKAVEMHPDDLRKLAQQIRYVAERYERVAVAMEEQEVDSILANGIETLRDEVIPKRLSSNAGSCERALSKAIAQKAKSEADARVKEIEAQVDQSRNRKLKKRR